MKPISTGDRPISEPSTVSGHFERIGMVVVQQQSVLNVSNKGLHPTFIITMLKVSPWIARKGFPNPKKRANRQFVGVKSNEAYNRLGGHMLVIRCGQQKIVKFNWDEYLQLPTNN